MVEACSGVLTTYLINPCKESINVLKQLGQSADGSNTIAEHRGTKPVLLALDKIVAAEAAIPLRIGTLPV